MNITRVHQIYASATSTGGDNVANIMVPYKGVIVACQLQLVVAVASIASAELSFQSANQLTQNDSTSILISTMSQAHLAGTGDAYGMISSTISGIAVPIDTISKVYAHISLSASQAWRLKGTLWIHTRA